MLSIVYFCKYSFKILLNDRKYCNAVFSVARNVIAGKHGKWTASINIIIMITIMTTTIIIIAIIIENIVNTDNGTDLCGTSWSIQLPYATRVLRATW